MHLSQPSKSISRQLLFIKPPDNSYSDSDPFLAPTPVSDGARTLLSPTADVFTPKTATASNTSATRAGRYANSYSRALTPASLPLGAGPLVPNSVPDYDSNAFINHDQGNSPPGIIGQPSTAPVTVAQLASGMESISFIDFENVAVTEGVFSFDEKAARVFAVENCVSDLALPTIVRILAVRKPLPSLRPAR